MAVQLFKLASEQWPSISATTSQTSNQYFHTFSRTHSYTNGTSISLGVATWFKNDGSPAAAFAVGQGAQSLCINGVLQQTSLYAITTTKVTLIAPAGGFKLKGYPITLETYNAKASVVVSAVNSVVAIP